MGVITRSNFADLVDPSFSEIFAETAKGLKFMYNTIFNVKTSDRESEKSSSVSDLGELAEIGEGEAVQSDDLYQGYDATHTHKKYGKKATITEEMIEDDQFEKIETQAKRLPIALNRTVERTAADVFNYAFTAGGGGKAQFRSGGDTYALCYASHPRTDSGTALNNTATSDLAEDSLQAAWKNLEETLDNRGNLSPLMGNVLLVPPALRFVANILMKSTSRVGTSDNDINPVENMLRVVVWPFLSAASGGSDTAWFVLDEQAHSLKWYWRRKGTLDRNVDFDTGNIEYKLTARYSVGFDDWRGVYGSKGDNS